MKKMNKRGFALAETLIVSTIVAGILIYLCIQFASLKRSYNRSFRYNSVVDLYALEDVYDYIADFPGTTKDQIISSINEQGYISVTKKGDNSYEDDLEDINIVSNDPEDTYGTKLFDSLDINQLIITKEDISSLDTTNFNPGMQNFIKINNSSKGNKYRLIAQFNSNNYATIVIPLESDNNE